MPPTLPVFALRLPLRLLPDAMHTQALVWALNHLLRGQRLRTRLPELNGRSICLDICDTGTRLHLRIENGRFISATSPSQVTIRGTLRDFLDLATRAEDADTLFFNRRLCIEGDTETGLHVKNLLDSLEYDWPAHVREVLPAPLAERAVNLARHVVKR